MALNTTSKATILRGENKVAVFLKRYPDFTGIFKSS